MIPSDFKFKFLSHLQGHKGHYRPIFLWNLLEWKVANNLMNASEPETNLSAKWIPCKLIYLCCGGLRGN